MSTFDQAIAECLRLQRLYLGVEAKVEIDYQGDNFIRVHDVRPSELKTAAQITLLGATDIGAIYPGGSPGATIGWSDPADISDIQTAYP